MTRRPRIAVSLGDPRGIGPEITQLALQVPLEADVTLVGPDDLVSPRAGDAKVGVGGWNAGVGDGGDRARERKAGTLAGRAIETVARLALDGQVDAIVTAPVEKHALRLAGFPWSGHTEWLAHLAGDRDVAMMLASDRLRVVLATIHVALRDVPALLTVDRVVRVGRVTERALREWLGLSAPRLALCALNPHAGEQGLFGDEETRVLEPAARTLGAAGPFPADTVFVRAMRGEFDAVIAPYHDVGMTAIKVASFGHAVNLTLGLPFPRTSPDHGTAMDVAGTGKADPSSMRKALDLAVELARKARNHDEDDEGED